VLIKTKVKPKTSFIPSDLHTYELELMMMIRVLGHNFALKKLYKAFEEPSLKRRIFIYLMNLSSVHGKD
jgi:hypothetical protein